MRDTCHLRGGGEEHEEYKYSACFFNIQLHIHPQKIKENTENCKENFMPFYDLSTNNHQGFVGLFTLLIGGTLKRSWSSRPGRAVLTDPGFPGSLGGLGLSACEGSVNSVQGML